MPVNNFISSFSSLGRAEKKRNESLLNGLPLYLCFINQKNQNFAFFSFLSIDILTVIISAILILQFKEKKTFFLFIWLKKRGWPTSRATRGTTRPPAHCCSTNWNSFQLFHHFHFFQFAAPFASFNQKKLFNFLLLSLSSTSPLNRRAKPGCLSFSSFNYAPFHGLHCLFLLFLCLVGLMACLLHKESKLSLIAE